LDSGERMAEDLLNGMYGEDIEVFDNGWLSAEKAASTVRECSIAIKKRPIINRPIVISMAFSLLVLMFVNLQS